MATEPRQLVEQIYEAFGRGDIEGILACLASDVSWDVAGRPEDCVVFGKRRGRDGALDFFRVVEANQEFRAFEPLAFHACGETVVVEGRETYVHKVTGRPVSMDWVHVFRVRDGRIAALTEYFDTAQVAQAYRA